MNSHKIMQINVELKFVKSCRCILIKCVVLFFFLFVNSYYIGRKNLGCFVLNKWMISIWISILMNYSSEMHDLWKPLTIDINNFSMINQLEYLQFKLIFYDYLCIIQQQFCFSALNIFLFCEYVRTFFRCIRTLNVWIIVQSFPHTHLTSDAIAAK